jgi:hypothetical protein
MDASQLIRDSVMRVTELRQIVADTPGLAQAVSDIKQLQARRFAGTYYDLLHSAQFKLATKFFLDELYSEKDYSARDAQFARIAGTLERIFPHQVVQTAVSLAQVHRLTEELDLDMAQHWMNNRGGSEVVRYVAAWRAVDRRSDRNTQLNSVVDIGHELDRLTRTPGLRFMLKMMRTPANLAGMGSLQQFLEAGFDTFAALGRQAEGVSAFLATVRTREAGLVELLFDADPVAGEAEISRTLAQA